MEEIIRKFISWAKIKIKIHFSEKIIYFREGEIWWASLGQNVGVEQNGKNINFERPILILKKFNEAQFWALPISSKIKMNKYSYIFGKDEKRFSLSLSQIRVMDKRRLLRCVGKISSADFDKIKTKIKEIIG